MLQISGKIKDKKGFNKLRRMKNSLHDKKEIYKEQKVIKNTEKRQITPISQQLKDEIDHKIRDEYNNFKCNTYEPKISIIIQNTDSIDEVIDCIGNDGYSNFELIIICDDDSFNLDDNLDYRTIIKNDDMNMAECLNCAFDVACGEYLLFLDSSITFFSGFITAIAGFIDTVDDAGFISCEILDSNTYNIESVGVKFRKIENSIKAINNKYESTPQFNGDVIKTISVSSTVALIKSDILRKCELFDDKCSSCDIFLDVSLKLHKAGYHNYILPIKAIHHKHTCEVISDCRDKYINDKWYDMIYENFYYDKIYAKNIFTDPLCIAFCVTQSDNNTTAGDYFTAKSFASNIKEELKWNVVYLAQNPTTNQKNWYFIDEDVDVIVSLLERYNINNIQSDNNPLLIAWPRNWFERWIDQPFFIDFDIILASSMKACKLIEKITDKKAHLFPIATDTKMFKEENNSCNEFICDYCFTGSYWGAKREITGCLAPGECTYKFHLYGSNWEDSEFKDYSKGFISYEMMPQIYASTKIVVDDANHATAKYGSVNSRVFDTIAAGKLVITNGTLGNNELFSGLIPEYHTKDELKNQINYYMQHEDKYENKIKQLQQIVLNNHTYKIRAYKLRQIIHDYYFK
ncbi:glycosyltransferase [Methanosphaera sp.]|uniref:glycosyltransferase family protein n=1 Tax=Methanosphaera sp. TaxID=2666342 RepID=UPI002A811D58|nr:glycosyltransferase [Methanosphaera sp.]